MDITATYQKYISLFEENKESFQKSDTEYVWQTKINAYKKFKEIGIPDHTNENYKYAGISEICSEDYELSLQSRKSNVDLNEFFECEVKDLDTHVVLLSNGEYYEKNKPIEGINENVIICSLKEAKVKHSEIFEKYYNKYASEINDGFVALNTMLASDGLFIYVPDNTKVNKTIQLINLTHGFNDKNILKRNLFIIGENSELSLIVCDHTLNNSKNFVVDVSESYIEKGGILQYHTLQNEPNKSGVINSLIVNLEEHAKINSFVISLHGGIIRNNLFTKLSGEYAEAILNGVNLTDRKQRIDNYTIIDHLAPNCTTNELYKGILDDEAKGSFAGRIIVRQYAQKTNAYQTNKNICLTPQAKMRTKPQLEIYADDVKCSHGAAVGQLDDNALFYLRQRGINHREAKLMLMFAFVNDIIQKIEIEALKNRIAHLINTRLRGEFNNCSHCLLNCHVQD